MRLTTPARLSGLPSLHRPDPEADLGAAVVVRQLQFPDGDSGAKVGLGVRSVKARKAAQARWGKRAA